MVLILLESGVQETKIMDFQHEQTSLVRTFPSPPGNPLKDTNTQMHTPQGKQTRPLHTVFSKTRRQI